MHALRFPAIPAAIAVFSALLITTAHAGNGMNTIGNGAESLGMGGADVAAVRNTSALALNPAALTGIETQAFDIALSPFYSASAHVDTVGNDGRVDDPINATAGAGYARRLQRLPSLVLGIGSFVQGGTGYNYKGLQTGFGNRDDLSALFGVFRLALGAGWQATETLSLGATFNVSYASARQKYFPETSDLSDPARPLIGLRLDGVDSFSVNGTIGALYQSTPRLRLGASYTSKTRLPLHGGTLTMNYDALGQGRVRYENARLGGLSVPQELSLGLAYALTPDWQLASDLRWIDWSVLRHTRVRANTPNNALAAPSIDAISPLNWRDQLVFALGTAYRWDEVTTLRAGVNISRNPGSRATLTPVFNLLEAYEIDLGYGRRLGEQWQFDAALQLIPPQSQRYVDPNGILGRSKETFEAFIVTVALSRRW